MHRAVEVFGGRGVDQPGPTVEGVGDRRQAAPKQFGGRSGTEGRRAEALVRPIPVAGKRARHRRPQTQERRRNHRRSAGPARVSVSPL